MKILSNSKFYCLLLFFFGYALPRNHAQILRDSLRLLATLANQDLYLCTDADADGLIEYDMLSGISRSQTQIAFQVGFNIQSYFTKCFKAKFGMSPSDFQINTSVSESQ